MSVAQRDSDEVVVYAPPQDRWPAGGVRRWPGPLPPRRTVALVAVMRDEAKSIPGWAADLRAQTRLPDEVVVADDGSRDGSAALLSAALADLGVSLRVLDGPPGGAVQGGGGGAEDRRGTGGGIAAGRNRAIAATSAEVVAVTDLGLGLAADWLERIVEPFEDDPATQVVAGFYAAVGRDGREVRRRMWPTLDRVDPATFLPASRSIAFSRAAWARVGGYPEWLTLTGEDTWFAAELRRRCPHWAFAPRAVVRWDAPDTLPAYWRKARYWAAGDGESGLFPRSYAKSALALTAAAAATLAAALVAARVCASAARPAQQRRTRGTARWWAAAAALGLSAAGAVARRAGLGPQGLMAEVGAQVARTVGWLEGRSRRSAVRARRAAAGTPPAPTEPAPPGTAPRVAR